VLGLASRDEAEVRQAWQQINETVLQHQSTVYPATAAAAPFLCRIVLDEATMWRAALAADLAFLSTGYDEPYAPAGTAQAVRDAVRPYVGELMGLWGTDDQGLDMALVAVSVAFPVEAAAIASPLRDWFGRSEPPLRTALGLALGFRSSADGAVKRIVEDDVGQSISWVVRTGKLIAHLSDQPGSPRKNEEPYINSPVLEAIHVASACKQEPQNRPLTSPRSSVPVDFDGLWRRSTDQIPRLTPGQQLRRFSCWVPCRRGTPSRPAGTGIITANKGGDNAVTAMHM
jgi:hypothetical protein